MVSARIISVACAVALPFAIVVSRPVIVPSPVIAWYT